MTGISPLAAAGAYARTAQGIAGGAAGAGSLSPGADFGAALGRAAQGLLDVGHEADAKSMQALRGEANLTDVVTAVSRAELALQSATAIRDKVVQAYQEVMRMPI